MYITKEWFLSAEHFKFPNLEGYNDEEIIYSIEIAEEWINQVITGNLIDEDLKAPNPKLKIVENLLQPYNPKDEKQVMLARDIKKAVGRATTFVLETGFNFITGSFSASIGDRSVNEVINFESSKEYIEDYIKTLLAKWYEPRLITQSAAVQYDLPKVDGGLIDGQEKPISYNEARNLFNELFKDKFNGTAPIKVEWTVPNDPNKGITISCDDCNKASGGTDCQEVGKCPSVESKLDTNKLQDEFLKLWDQDNSDITITKGSLKGKIKADILKPYLFKSEAEITYEKQIDHQFDFEALSNQKLDTSAFFKTINETLKSGTNVSFDIDELNKTITINVNGSGTFLCTDLESCQDKIIEIISSKFYEKTETLNKTEINKLLDNKQNKGYLNYTFKDGQQDREFFQTYDIENEVKGPQGLMRWLKSLTNQSRCSLYGSIIVIDRQGRKATGTFIYTSLPNSTPTIKFDILAQAHEGFNISSDASVPLVRQASGFVTDQFTFYSYVNPNSEGFTCSALKCDTPDIWRFQIITIFGNNNGKLGFSKEKIK